ncbi:MAG: T9SS type A sorting domain-containing protein [candidate division WOR-3 bacterium]
MKKTIQALVLFVILLAPLFAVEKDDKVIIVPTGWTSEKDALAKEWQGMSLSQKQSIHSDLQRRFNNLLPRLPADVYSAEENEYVGYRIRLQKLWQKLQSQPNDWNYAEFTYILNEAENYLKYLEREKTLPKNEYEESGSNFNNPKSFDRDDKRQGTGWDVGYVDLSLVDHITPSVAAFNNYVFVSASNEASGIGNDTMVLWRSTNYGNNWGRWHSYGTSTADRIVFDVVIDPGNQYLYESYTYITSGITGDIWVRRFTNLNDSSQTDIYNVENTSDFCIQPHLSVEHIWADHRICCIYHNYTTGNVVIAQSTDQGQNWSTVYTSSWTSSAYAIPKGGQGAYTQSTDKFVFVARKSNNSLVILESVSGASGSWTETEYVHSQSIDNIDVSASHNYDRPSVVVAFGYPWTSTDFNVRILFRMASGGNFVSQLVDNDAIMTKTPVISCDGEYAGNNAGPDYYHLSYYKDHNGDNYYIPFALRTLNDSTALDNMYYFNPNYFEVVGANVIDTLVSSFDFGRPYGFYQMDMTTMWNATHNQWFPAIVWMRYYTSTSDADPRLSFPDQTYGIWEHKERPTARVDASLSPNPSNGSAKLSYTTKNPGIVKISLYDASGRLVDNITNDSKSAGTYTLNLNNQGLPNGIYFVRVKTPEGTATKTMTIVR